MATFTVWKFDSADGAEEAQKILHGAADDQLITIIDSAFVRWDPGAASPTTHHADTDRWTGAGWGAFWGLLFGVLFFIPIVGAAAGGAIGAIAAAMSRVGIQREDIDRIRDEVTPGTSALFVVTKDGEEDRVAERFHGLHSTLVTGNLAEAELKDLQKAFNQD